MLWELKERIKLNFVPQVHVPEPCAKTAITTSLGPRIIIASFNASSSASLGVMTRAIRQSFFAIF
jgi:hypothetical protein